MDQKQMTEEEMKKAIEASKKEWDALIADFKADPDKPVTKGELLKVVEFITSEVQMIGEMSQAAFNNTITLHQKFQQMMAAITGQRVTPPVTKTKGGIIIP